MPDIYLFRAYENRFDPFAKYDYMNVLPSLKALESFLHVCNMARKAKVKLHADMLKNEAKAFMAIKNNNYNTSAYPWENYPNDCWYVESNHEIQS